MPVIIDNPDTAALANQHQPKDVDAMRMAVHELRNRGFGDHCIADVTSLSVEYVRRTLGERIAPLTR
jgi:hypothetical protein